MRKKVASRRATQQLSEAKLRKIIREEVTRQVLLEEGIKDALMAKFSELKSKITDKVKAKIKQKLEELSSKLKEMLAQLKKVALPENFQQFMEQLKSAPGGGDVQQIVAASKDSAAQEAFAALSDLKTMELPGADKSQKEGKVSRSLLSNIGVDFAIIEEQHEQWKEHLARTHQDLLSEVALLGGITTLLSAWWMAQKAVLGVLGLAMFISKGLSLIFKAMSLDPTAEFFESLSHKFHKVEEFWLSKTAFPPQLQYTIYYALAKMQKKQPVSIEEFKKAEGDLKEEKEAIFKTLKFIIIAPLAIEALSHIGPALKNAFYSMHSAFESIHAAAETRSGLAAGAEVTRAARAVAST